MCIFDAWLQYFPVLKAEPESIHFHTSLQVLPLLFIIANQMVEK